MLGARPEGAYGWLPTCAGLLLFLTARCDAGPGAVMRVGFFWGGGRGGRLLMWVMHSGSQLWKKKSQENLRGGNGERSCPSGCRTALGLR